MISRPVKVYKDEPIPVAAEQVENIAPPQYRDMKKIAVSRGSCYDPVEKIFYKQGKFMEYFEDDYDYREEFTQYFPTYRSMNDHELRGYFSWRAKVRRGVIGKTSLSFVYVYIYELINQIGVRSPEEGFHVLKNFWTAYKEIDSSINRYVKLWLKDYVVYNNLDKSLLEDLLDMNFNNAALTLLNHKSHSAGEVFSALCALSPYNLKNSRFFRQYPGEVESVACIVISALSDYHEKNCKSTFCERFFGNIYSYSYLMFSSAVFYDQIRKNDFVYVINDFCKYICTNGNWKCESFFPYGGKSRPIGDLLKNIDFFMRQNYNFKSALKIADPPKVIRGIISRAIEKHRESQRKTASAKIEIDVSRLPDIRKAALETQEKLLVEEFEETSATEYFDGKAVPENNAVLNDTEYMFMRCLLYGRAHDDTIRSKGMPLSVLVDAINEKLFDRFGDTVIVETGNRPELIADYVQELKEIIRE